MDFINLLLKNVGWNMLGEREQNSVLVTLIVTEAQVSIADASEEDSCSAVITLRHKSSFWVGELVEVLGVQRPSHKLTSRVSSAQGASHFLGEPARPCISHTPRQSGNSVSVP